MCKVLNAEDVLGRRVLFRCNKPRAIRNVRPTSQADELRQCFGPLDGLLADGGHKRSLLEFRLRPARLATLRTALPPAPAGIAPATAAGLRREVAL